MAVAQAEIEAGIARLAAKSRAAGIHMILATQRPDVKVITGTIKANFPARVAFKVSRRRWIVVPSWIEWELIPCWGRRYVGVASRFR